MTPIELIAYIKENDLKKKNLLVVTGAGVSLASGIPTFRGSDPGAVWANDVLEKATLAFFHRSPVESWLWYLEKFAKFANAKPNDAHVALAELEKLWQGNFLLMTQNIDTLHEQAGSQKLIKVHGSIDKIRCSRRGCSSAAPNGTIPYSLFECRLKALIEDPKIHNIPRCAICRKLLRPHVLWFDEYYQEHIDYQYSRLLEFLKTFDAVMFIGTSISVSVPEHIFQVAQREKKRIIIIDPVYKPSMIDILIVDVKAQAELFLPELIKQL